MGIKQARPARAGIDAARKHRRPRAQASTPARAGIDARARKHRRPRAHASTPARKHRRPRAQASTPARKQRTPARTSSSCGLLPLLCTKIRFLKKLPNKVQNLPINVYTTIQMGILGAQKNKPRPKIHSI